MKKGNTSKTKELEDLAKKRIEDLEKNRPKRYKTPDGKWVYELALKIAKQTDQTECPYLTDWIYGYLWNKKANKNDTSEVEKCIQGYKKMKKSVITTCKKLKIEERSPIVNLCIMHIAMGKLRQYHESALKKFIRQGFKLQANS